MKKAALPLDPVENFPRTRSEIRRESLKYSDRIIICENGNKTSACAPAKRSTLQQHGVHLLIHSLSFVCPEVRKHTVVLNYQAQSAAGIFAGRFQQRKPPPPAPRGGYQQIATKMFSPAFRLPASKCSAPSTWTCPSLYIHRLLRSCNMKMTFHLSKLLSFLR